MSIALVKVKNHIADVETTLFHFRKEIVFDNYRIEKRKLIVLYSHFVITKNILRKILPETG